MARLFDDGSNEYLEFAGTPPVTGFPLAMAAWFYSDNTALPQTLVSLGESGGTDYWIRIAAAGDTEGDPVHAQIEGTNNGNAYTSTDYSANTWHHAIGVFAANDDVRAFIDGGSKGTDDHGSGWEGTWDRVAIGRLVRSSPLHYMSGRIAHAAIWDLSDWLGATASDKADEFERVAVPALAAGYSPDFFPLGLKAHYRLDEAVGTANAFDHVGHYDMTAYNSPSVADHPGGLIFPSAAIWTPQVSAPPAGNAPTGVLSGSLVGPFGGPI